MGRSGRASAEVSVLWRSSREAFRERGDGDGEREMMVMTAFMLCWFCVPQFIDQFDLADSLVAQARCGLQLAQRFNK